MKITNPLSECKKLGWGLWQCPPFLFLVMGFITIVAMVISSLFAMRVFPEPEIAAIITATGIAILFLVIGNVIVGGFNRLAEASRMKSQFVSIISHQLRTPSSIFKWTLEALQQTLREPQKHIENDINLYISNLQNASQRMIRLVNTLLDVTRIESQTIVLQNENFSLLPVAERLIQDATYHAQTSHITINFEKDAVLPLVFADRTRIIMVMETFLDNAVRYTLNAGSITARLNREGAFIRFSISDTGVGIPILQQKNIFQKFFRASNITQFQTEGTGIDLFVSKYIIEKSGGTIGFSSQENKGSTFWFILPIIKT